MLDALSTTLTHTITLLAKSFRLSSLFPALCFVVTNYLLFLSHFSERNILTWLRNESFGHLIFLTFLLTALIGYILNYLNFFLIYLAEGYPFRTTCLGQEMIKWYRDRKVGLEEQANLWERRKAWLEEQAKLSESEQRRVWLEEQAKLSQSEQRFCEDELADYFPPDPYRCAPTALGNVVAAFETCPSRRYGIDAVHMWPRLLPVLNEKKYAVFVEREKEGFDFFLNFSILSGVLAVESVLLRLFLERPMFTWIALASGCAAFLFYQAAVRSAINWGDTIKTAFDLYRYELAEQLALKPFVDKEDERETWESISSFIKRGRWDDFGAFHYPLPCDKEAKVEGEIAQPEAPSDETTEGEAV